MSSRRRYLQAALVVTGIGALLVYPFMMIWPPGFVWTPAHHKYEPMIAGIYATLGVFLIRAAREPEAHLSLIWFTVWSSVVHGGIMAIQASLDPTERAHFVGDVPVVLLAGAVLGWLTRGGTRVDPQARR